MPDARCGRGVGAAALGVVLATAAALVLSSGCAPKTAPDAMAGSDEAQTNELMVRLSEDQNMRNAVLAERTVYAYHFASGRSELTPLGQRTVEILAAVYRQQPGDLHLERGDASSALYDARVQCVRRELAEAGVEADKVNIMPGLPGGDGTSAEHAYRAVQEDLKPAKSSAPAREGTVVAPVSGGTGSMTTGGR
jgi:type IV pilus biogenesis protein CpaD/CtpE